MQFWGFLEFFSDKTLNIVYAMCLFIIFLVLWVIYPIYKKPYMCKMMAGYMCLTISMLLIPFRDLIPDFLSIIGGNILAIAGEYLVMISFLEMIHKKIQYKYYYILLVLFTIIHVYFAYIQPNVAIRIINYSGFLIIPTFYFIVSFLMTSIKNHEYSYLAIWVSYIVITIANIARLLNSLGFEDITQLYRGASIFKTYILLSIFVNIVKIITILMVNTRDLVK